MFVPNAFFQTGLYFYVYVVNIIKKVHANSTVIGFGIYFLCINQGCGAVFKRRLPNWRVVQNFHSPSKKKAGPKYRKVHAEVKNTLPRLASGFVFLLTKPEFYSHLASWRVLIHTPD
jgi:hypothetical protein